MRDFRCERKNKTFMFVMKPAAFILRFIGLSLECYHEHVTHVHSKCEKMSQRVK